MQWPAMQTRTKTSIVIVVCALFSDYMKDRDVPTSIVDQRIVNVLKMLS